MQTTNNNNLWHGVVEENEKVGNHIRHILYLIEKIIFFFVRSVHEALANVAFVHFLYVGKVSWNKREKNGNILIMNIGIFLALFRHSIESPVPYHIRFESQILSAQKEIERGTKKIKNYEGLTIVVVIWFGKIERSHVVVIVQFSGAAANRHIAICHRYAVIVIIEMIRISIWWQHFDIICHTIAVVAASAWAMMKFIHNAIRK